MSNATNCPAGSPGLIVAYSLLHGLSILLLLCAATLMGWVSSLDGFLTAWMSDLMQEEFSKSLSPGILWFSAVLVAFGVPTLLLCCRHAWQRLTLWIAALAVLALWAPVLCLAAHRPDISMLWMAAAAGGLFVTFQRFWMARQNSSPS